MDFRDDKIPKRLAILTRLTTLLETIQPSRGYQFDLKGKVFRGRELFGDELDMPALTLLEAPTGGMNIPANLERTVNAGDWTVFVQGMVKDNKQTPVDEVYWLHADVVRCLSTVTAMDAKQQPVSPATYRLGGLIDDLTLTPAVCRPPEAGVSSKAFFWMPIIIKYTLDNTNPYHYR